MPDNSGKARKPDWHAAPRYTTTLGPAVGELGALAHFTPYPEQQLLLNDLFAVDPDHSDRSAAFEMGVVCARQQMKTGFLKLAALGFLYVLREPLTIWSAQKFDTATEAQNDLIALIDSSHDLSRRVEKIIVAAGKNEIRMMDGSRLLFKARSSDGGRGLTANRVILDEAYALQPGQVGALFPTLISVRDPQVLYASSAGMAKSYVLRSVRDRGRDGGDRHLAYSEWCAPRKQCAQVGCQHAPGTPGCALDDIDLWRMACPVTARKDPSMEPIRLLRNSMSPDEFMRECLGWWDEAKGESPINQAMWDGLLVDHAKPPTLPVFAFDVSPARDCASIVAASDMAGRIRVELTGAGGVIDHRPGTEWLTGRMTAISRRYPNATFGFAAGGAAESCIPDLESAGVRVTRIARRDMIAACGRFYDLAARGTLCHIGQDDMTESVMRLRKKTVGEAAFLWVKSDQTADITAGYAASLAVWLCARSRDITSMVW